jgi:hypothetical protein
MPSLMQLLLDTMPLAAVENTLKSQYHFTTPPPIALQAAVGKYVRPILRFIPNGVAPGDLSPHSPPAPSATKISAIDALEKVEGFGFAPTVAGVELAPLSPTGFHQAQSIWGFDLGASAGPEELAQITCRVSGEDYARYQVFDRVRFGFEDNPAAYRAIIKAVDTKGTKGRTVELPLTDQFLRMTWLTQDTELAPKGHPLWPLESQHDVALLRVFVYELLGDTTTPTPLAGESADEQAAFDAVLAACQKIGPTMGDGDDAASKLFGDTTFFPEGLAAGQGAAVGEASSMRTTRTRIVVALSVTMCKWRCDFPPGVLPIDANQDGTSNPVGGSPLAAGRFYPNVMIIASAAFQGFEASIQLDRPATTTNDSGQCCKSAPTEMLPDLSTVFVTETNDVDLLYPGPVPLWSNLFAYYQTDGYKSLQTTRMQFVRNEAAFAGIRTGQNLVTRNADPGFATLAGAAAGPIRALQSKQTTKLPRQGWFDSVHLAPPMCAPSVAAIASVFPPVPSVGYLDRTPISVDANLQASFARIGMAPFCAHDCFHMHWRWSDQFAAGKFGMVQHQGWGATGPYTVPGVPMVPLNQSVDFWHRAACQVTYHAMMGTDGAQIPPGKWQVVCHHGGAYGLDANSWTMSVAAKLNDGTGMTPYLLNANGNAISLSWSGSWAILYWRLRYTAMVTTPGTAARLSERTEFTNLPAARDL